MLDRAFKNKFIFDAVMMPINVMDAHFESFEKKVLPVLKEHNIGVISMKPLGFGMVYAPGFGHILETMEISPEECLRYAMSLPVDVVVTGCDSLPILEQALKVAQNFTPMTEAERSALLEKTAKAAESGRYEPWKTTLNYDLTTLNPHLIGMKSITFGR